jgi:DNA-binding transcriptional LysR family regulator
MQEYTPEFTFAPELTGRRLDEISALLAVMDTGGFAPAARVLGRDASVLSRRVTALEQRLGIRLIERTTRSVKPTEAGARFAERMRAAIAAMTEAELEASDTGTAPRGTLRLALPRAFGRMWIAPLLPEFLSACPHVRIEASYADRYVDLVADGYDVAIRVGDLPDSGLVARKLANQWRLICAAPSYLAARGTPMTPADLGMHDCLQFRPFRIPGAGKYLLQ